MGLSYACLYSLASTVYDEYTAYEFGLFALGWCGFLALAVWGLRCLTTGGAMVTLLLGSLSAYVLGRAAVAALIATLVMGMGLSLLPQGMASRRWDSRGMLARGIPFALAALIRLCSPDEWYGVEFFAGVLSYTCADIWATQLGVRCGGRPRSPLTGGLLVRGESGGVTILGTLAGIFGAMFPLYVWRLWHHKIALWRGHYDGPLVPEEVAFYAVLGIAALLLDSVLGAGIQFKGRHPNTMDTTELSHVEGVPSVRIRGVRWVDNEVVDLLSALVAGGLSIVAYEFWL